MDAARASYTPINAFMDMTIVQFYDFYNAIATVISKAKPKKKK